MYFQQFSSVFQYEGFKIFFQPLLCPIILDRFSCDNCNAIYCGQTSRSLRALLKVIHVQCRFFVITWKPGSPHAKTTVIWKDCEKIFQKMPRFGMWIPPVLKIARVEEDFCKQNLCKIIPKFGQNFNILLSLRFWVSYDKKVNCVFFDLLKLVYKNRMPFWAQSKHRFSEFFRKVRLCTNFCNLKLSSLSSGVRFWSEICKILEIMSTFRIFC